MDFKIITSSEAVWLDRLPMKIPQVRSADWSGGEAVAWVGMLGRASSAPLVFPGGGGLDRP